MQHTAIFEEQVPLTPKDMRDEIESIDDILQKKLQLKLEGRCSHHGFVLPGSVKILSRSMGVLEKGRFTGSILFHVHAEGDVLNPPEGTIIEGEVIRKNKMGMYVSYQDAIRIILPRDLHIGNDAFEAIELKDRVSVEIKKSRFQVNDPYILSVGVFRSRVGKRAAVNKVNAAAAATADALEDMEGQEGQEGPSGLENLEAAVDELEDQEETGEDEEGGEEGGEDEVADSGAAAEEEAGVE